METRDMGTTKRAAAGRLPLRLAAVVVCALACLSGQETPPGPAAAAPAPSARQVVVGPEDTISILALNAEEISKTWRIGAGGELNLPMVGKLMVGGMTVEQVEQELAVRLKRFVRNPQVTVYVSEFRSQPVTVSGSVEKPGTIQLQGSSTVFSVLVQAGGVKDQTPTVTLTRSQEFGPIPHPAARLTDDGRYSIVELATKEVMTGHGPEADLPVLPYDVITAVADERKKMVFIAGEVNRPGAIELVSSDTVSITKAIAMAGGLSRTSSPGKTMIRHINSKGVETSMSFVDLKKIMSGKTKDLELSEGDIVIVPSSQFTSVMTYLQSASMAAVTTGIFVLGRL